MNYRLMLLHFLIDFVFTLGGNVDGLDCSGQNINHEQQGCVAKFLKFQRFYTWDELAIKRYENYRYMLGNGSKYCSAPYKKGVFFSRRKVRR